MVKIGAELPKLSQNKAGYPFLDHTVLVACSQSKTLECSQVSRKVVNTRVV